MNSQVKQVQLEAATLEEVRRTQKGHDTEQEQERIITVRVSRTLHAKAILTAAQLGTSLNLLCRRAIVRAVLFPDGTVPEGAVRSPKKRMLKQKELFEEDNDAF